jgi:hypothetical protein
MDVLSARTAHHAPTVRLTGRVSSTGALPDSLNQAEYQLVEEGVVQRVGQLRIIARFFVAGRKPS